MIILRQKNYAKLWNIDGEIKNGATDNVKRTQNYYDSVDWSSPAVTSGAEKIGSNAGVRTLGGQTVYDNKVKTGDIYDMGVKKGKQSVGLKQGAINTWKGMNNTQKGLAIGTAAAATLGTGMMIARNRRKRKEAERELELERARNRR
jgi:hypothetical protein